MYRQQICKQLIVPWLQNIWANYQPQQKARLSDAWVTDKEELEEVITAKYELLDLGEVFLTKEMILPQFDN